LREQKNDRNRLSGQDERFARLPERIPALAIQVEGV
jgi:hypothetical protein